MAKPLPHPSALRATAAWAACSAGAVYSTSLQCFHLDSVLLSRYKTHILIFTFSKRHEVTVLVCFSPNWGALICRGEGRRVWPAAPSYSTRACSTSEEPLPHTHPPCCDSFSLCKSSPALQPSPLPPAPVGLWSCRRVLEVQQGAASIPAACRQDHSTRLTQPWTTHTSCSQCCKPCCALPGHLQGTLQPSSRGCAPAVTLQPSAVAVTEGCNSCNHCC